MKFFIGLISLVFCLSFINRVDGQILLQLEVIHEVEAKKFYPGEILTFKSNSIAGEWQSRKLERLILEENLIIFDDGMEHLSDITHVKLVNSTTSSIGKLFTGFGAGWLLFGGIAHFASDYKFTWGTAIIGGVGIAVGWLINKVAARRTYKMGKNANLRIIDISFPEATQLAPASNIKP